MTNLRVLLIVIFSICLYSGVDAQVIGQQPITPELPTNEDGKETLDWVVERTTRIEKLMNSAMLSHDQVNLMMRLLDVHVEFDAISLVGLYCPNAQAAAEKGRESSDLLNYRKEKDMNSMMVRALEAKEQAIKVRMASNLCLESHTDDTEDSVPFAPNVVLIEEAGWAILDLEDGLASTDFHIFSQKTEHAIRLIEEIEHIATTLGACTEVEQQAAIAKDACLQALGAPNWVTINRASKKAIEALHQIEKAECVLAKESSEE